MKINKLIGLTLLMTMLSSGAFAKGSETTWVAKKTFTVKGTVKPNARELQIRSGEKFNLEITGGDRMPDKPCFFLICPDQTTKHTPSTYTITTRYGKATFPYGSSKSKLDDGSITYFFAPEQIKQAFSITTKYWSTRSKGNFRSEVRECEIKAYCTDSYRYDDICTYAMGTQTVHLYDELILSHSAGKMISQKEVIATAQYDDDEPSIYTQIKSKEKCVLNVPQ